MTKHTNPHHKEFGAIPTHEQMKRKDFSQLENPTFREKLENQHNTYHTVKRVLDFTIALILMILLIPLWVILFILIRLDSQGPAFFSHKRVGLGGKKFTLYKFRTMKKGVDDQEHAPLSEGDPRVTKAGRLLRRTSLDELPQLWNVLKGDMALIGPRPEMPFLVEKYTPRDRSRLLVRPGITGLWQVMGRKDIPLHENVEYDLYYLLNESLLLDLLILGKTCTVVITGKGAY